MTFEEAVKSSAAYRQIVAEAKNPSHSYMIVTSDVVTSKLLAYELIETLSGGDERSKDVYMLPFGEKVLVSDADFIGETAYLMPSELDKKFFVLSAAETANETAQNKLLKILEEPPETAVIILLCAAEYAMLPTVRSRCRIISPAAYSEATLSSVLEEEYYGIDNPSLVIALSGGSLGKLKKVAEGKSELDFTVKMLECMRKSGDILPYATALAKKEVDLEGTLDCLELIMRDCMAQHFAPSHVWLKGNVMDIREISAMYTPEAALKVMPLIKRARRRSSLGGNVNSVVDELLFSILEEKAKCLR